MRSHHRKLLLLEPSCRDQNTSFPESSCHQLKDKKQKCFFQKEGIPPAIPKLPLKPEIVLPPPQHDSGDAVMKHLAILAMTITACVIFGVLVLCILCAIVRAYSLRRNNTSRRNPPIYFGTQEDFLDEDHGPDLDHPIWYIHTVGLPQAVIDSIVVFLYKKGEGLIEGTECSVCLNEFQEDETLRLLPKCSHAFHMACIDTWLRSHKNCPLCRAPIVIDAVLAQTRQSAPSSSGLDSRNENLEENLASYGGEVSNSFGEGGTSEMSSGVDSNCILAVEDVSSAENSGKLLPRLKTRNGDSDSRLLSDLADNRRVVEEDMQPMRRSVSLDSSSASKIYNAVASAVNDKRQLSLDIQLVQHKNLKSKSVSKRSSGSSSIYRLIKSSSIGSSLQKGPISMKRSLSSGGKSSSSRHGRRHSIIPLSR